MASAPTHAPHAHSPRLYYIVFGALLLLTASTVAASYVELGAWHTPVGMIIALAKATLIVLIFMHGLESGRLVWMVLAAAFLFLAILYAFTLADYATRRIDDGVRDPGARSSLNTAGPTCDEV
jgi:cytochrome c oxidase subunit IV